jgi:hypothetical protein
VKYIVSIIVVLCFPAYAQDHPTNGLIHNTTENSSIQHRCTLKGTELHCEMNQTFIRQQMRDVEVPKVLRERLAQMKSEEANTAKFRQDCKEITEISSQLEAVFKKPENKRTQKEREGFGRLSKHSIDKLKEFIGLYEAYCNKPSERTREALVRHQVLEETKTCRVGSNYWTEVFVRSKGIEAGNFGSTNSWVTKSQPTGPCGVLLANRWELDTLEGKSTFWNYIARKVVTNPAGETAFGLKCNAMDEGTYRYVWQSQEIGLDCRTIKFSPL